MRPFLVAGDALGNLTNQTPSRDTAMRRETMSRTKDMPADDETPLHVALASAALLEGWTRQQVIAALVGRIRRDEGYLAYPRATGRRTSYDDQVKADMRALALAACWLADVTPAVSAPSETSQTEGR
jgi:hypothetical protein